MKPKDLAIAGTALLLLGVIPVSHDHGRHPNGPSSPALIGVAVAYAGEDGGPERENGGSGSDDRHGDDSERGGDREIGDRGTGSASDYDEHADDGREFEPDTVLAIDLTSDARRRARAMGFRVVSEEKFASLGFRVAELSTPGGLPIHNALQKLRAADPAGSYDLNPRYATAGTPCDGVRCDAQRQVGWPLAGCPLPVSIGMVDTAVAGENPALRGHRIVQQHFGNSGTSAAGTEHGSQIASLFIGNPEAGFSGLLPHATLLAANVFDVARDGVTTTNALKIAQGFDWVVGQRPSVINVAIAGPDNNVLHETVRRAIAAGIPIVAAAGNAGHAAPPRYPAAYGEVIAVTAVDRYKNVFEGANEGGYITLAAPGVQIWVADAEGHGRFADGTSFATPFVSAEVAVIRSGQPAVSPASVTDTLRHHAMRVGADAQDGVFGAGLLQSQGCPSTPVAGPAAGSVKN